MSNSPNGGFVAGSLSVATRARQRHASLSHQLGSSGSGASIVNGKKPLVGGGGASSTSVDAGSLGLTSKQRPHPDLSLTQTLGGTAATTASGGGKRDLSGSVSSLSSSSKVKNLLTQLPEIPNSNTNSNSSSGPPSRALRKLDDPLRTTTTTGGGGGAPGVKSSALHTAHFEAQLLAWRRQPKNLSPAAGLRLPAMLPPPLPTKRSKVLLCLDIDETLVHASFTPAKPYDVKITIDVDGERGDIFVAYRPHVREFIQAVGQMFEIAIFTASQSCYANPLMDALDADGFLGRNRMYRQHCTEVNGARVKDLSLLGRSLDRVCLLDNSPVAYLFQPRNAIPIVSWFDDSNDTELLKLLPMLRQLAEAESVYDVLDPFNCCKHS